MEVTDNCFDSGCMLTLRWQMVGAFHLTDCHCNSDAGVGGQVQKHSDNGWVAPRFVYWFTVGQNLSKQQLEHTFLRVTFLHFALDAVSCFAFSDTSVRRALTLKQPRARQNLSLGNINCDFNPCAIPFKTSDFFCSFAVSAMP
jgi:hypothetical protein